MGKAVIEIIFEKDSTSRGQGEYSYIAEACYIFEFTAKTKKNPVATQLLLNNLMKIIKSSLHTNLILLVEVMAVALENTTKVQGILALDNKRKETSMTIVALQDLV